MIRIWGRVSSSNVQAALWCLNELDLTYERVDAGYLYGQVDTPEYLAMNPNGTIPTLEDEGGLILWETGAILRYLAHKYAPDDFWPTDLIARTNIDKWAEWSKLNIARNFTAPIFWQVVRTPPSRQNKAAVTEALATLNHFLDIADRQLSNHRYIAGEQFSLADIQFGHCLYRYFDIDINRKTHPNLNRYYQELSNRPAFKTHVMISYEELREND